MAQQPHADELRETVRAAFAHFDVDGSGAIDATELRDLVAKLGGYLTDKELQAALSALDKDGNGVVDESEFTAWWMAQSSDLDGDGQVGELERAMERVKAFGQSRFHVDIHSAVWRRSLDAVQRLLESDAELANAVDATEYGCGNMPLHYAAYQGHADVCAALLTGGAKINATNAFGCTPLFLAAQQSRLSVVRLLLEHEADIRITEREHKLTAVDVCTSDEVLAAFRTCSGGVPGTPETPTIVNTTDASVVVEWTTPNDQHDQIAPISGYKLRAAPSAQSSAACARSVLVGTQPTQFEIDELQPDTEYVIQVAAINLHGISQFSTGTAPTRTRPARPLALSQLRARAMDATSIELVWISEAGESESACVVQQRIDAERDLWKTVGKVDAAVGRLVISNLFEGRKYSFRAAVVNSSRAQSDFVVVDTRTQKAAEPRSSLTPLTERRPRDTLRDIVSATHRLRPEAKTGSKEIPSYPQPRDASEPQLQKPRLATMVRAAAKPSAQPVARLNKADNPRGYHTSDPLVVATHEQPDGEQTGMSSGAQQCRRVSPKHKPHSGRHNKHEETIGSADDDEDDYVYFDELDSEEEEDDELELEVNSGIY